MSDSSAEIVVPFLKWAGGKRWLAQRSDIHFPQAARYIEPFLGSGAIFFDQAPRRAILSDLNEELIETYQCVRDAPHQVAERMQRHAGKHSLDYYYKVRATIPKLHIDRAARFIYLNRTCWNGLYRVNLKGEFNVPIGTKDAVVLESDSWEVVADALSSAVLLAQDFEQTIADANEGDIVFADPPYTVKHNLNGFVKYNESIFSWDDQCRLCDALSAAAGRGAIVIVTNAAHSSIQELYSGIFTIKTLSRSSVLAGDSRARGVYDEFLITANYPIDYPAKDPSADVRERKCF